MSGKKYAAKYAYVAALNGRRLTGILAKWYNVVAPHLPDRTSSADVVSSDVRNQIAEDPPGDY